MDRMLYVAARRRQADFVLGDNTSALTTITSEHPGTGAATRRLWLRLLR